MLFRLFGSEIGKGECECFAQSFFWAEFLEEWEQRVDMSCFDIGNGAP